jgi:competence protein ComEC
LTRYYVTSEDIVLLFWVAGAFIGGVLLGEAVQIALPFVIVCVLLLGVAAWIVRRLRWRIIPLAAIGLCLGVARVPHPGPPTPADLAYYNGRAVVLTGRVDAEPDVRDTGANYQIAVDHLTVSGRTLAVDGGLLLHTSRSVALEYGHEVQVTGRLVAPQNTGAAPFRDILAQRGIVSEVRFPRLIDRGATSGGLLSWLVPFREYIEAGINSWLPEPEAALLIAITLGARSASLGDLAPALIATGLIHLIAISGIKVAMVAGIVNQLARKAANRLTALLLSIGTLYLYVLLTGGTPSGVRSAAMWTMIFIAGYLGRGTLALLSLALVAAVMTALNPGIIHDIGFQMSVIGTAAIVGLTDPIQRFLRRVPSPIREAAAVTIAAQIGTLPIVIIGFHVVSFTSPLANAVALPLIPILILLGFVIGVFSSIAMIAAPLSAVAYALTHAVVAVAQWLSSVPGSLDISTIAPWFAVSYYTAVVAAIILVLRRTNWVSISSPHVRARELAASGILGASLLTVSLMSNVVPAPSVSLTWIGSGDSVLLKSGDQAVLIDGSARPLDLLRRLGQLLPFDTHRLDAIVVTDPRSTNVVGLTSVLDHYRVSEVLDVGAEYPSVTYATWRSRLRGQAPVYALRTHATITVGSVRIEVAGPDAVCPSAQNCAGMLRVLMPGATVLLATAASREEQFEATFRGVNLRADAVVCGDVGCDPTLLRASHATRALTAGSGLLSDGPSKIAGQ